MKRWICSNIMVLFFGILLVAGCSYKSPSTPGAACDQEKKVKDEVLMMLESLTQATVEKDYPRLFKLVDAYFAEDTVIEVVNPYDKNRRVQMVPLAQYKFMVRQMPRFVIDYSQQNKGLQIELASDCQAAEVKAVQLETTTMMKNAALMMAPYIFKDKVLKDLGNQVTIESEEKTTVNLEYREGKWLITRLKTEIIRADLI